MSYPPPIQPLNLHSGIIASKDELKWKEVEDFYSSVDTLYSHEKAKPIYSGIIENTAGGWQVPALWCKYQR